MLCINMVQIIQIVVFISLIALGSPFPTKDTYLYQQTNYYKDMPINDPLNKELPLFDSDVSGGDHAVIKYKNGLGRQAVLKVAKEVHHDFQTDRFIAITCTSQEALDQLKYNKNIESIEVDSVWTEESILEEEQTMELDYIEDLLEENPNDNRFLQAVPTIPFGVSIIQADKLSYGPHKAMVCVVDTGAAALHPLFDPSLLSGANRVSFVDGSNLSWKNDTRGHGTHVAGILSARANVSNFLSIRGIGKIPLYITRGLNDAGNARESDIRQSMEQCEAAGAKVISLSLSGSSMTSLMTSLIDRLYAKNIIIVAASGNGGSRSDNFPAAYNKVIGVGAVDRSENYWFGSNYGPYLELTAPGVGITSAGITWKGEYIQKVYTGTSMATPHVAGVSALLLSHYPLCTATQIRYAMAYTAKDKNRTGCDEFYGYGIVQAKSAFDFLSSHPCPQAKWGINVGDGACSAVDVPPSRKLLRKKN